MAPFTLCAGLGAGHGSSALRRAARHWDALELDQILVGETDLPPHTQRQLYAEVASTSNDEPALVELLRLAAERSQRDWLLLVSSDALLTPTLVDNLTQLCRPGSPRRLVFGRAWRMPEIELEDEEPVESRLASNGQLDPPGLVSWLLLPRATLLAAPAELSCCPADAADWLIRTAQQLGWPVLEASAAAPLLRPVLQGASPLPSLSSTSGASGVVLPQRPGAPLLSLLLAAPEAELERLSALLCPSPSLPWEVVARPAEAAEAAGELASAWNSALEVCQAAIAWPITANLPPLALLPVLLRCFERPAVELVQLGPLPRPGALVIQSDWLRRLGGIQEHGTATLAFSTLQQQALQRGATCLTLPLTASAPIAATAATGS